METNKLGENKRFAPKKELLSLALMELMQEKSVRDITVRELAGRAHINRSTFYRHYHDVFDMKAQMERDLSQDFRQAIRMPKPLNSIKDFRVLCLKILHFFAEKQVLFQLLYSQSSNEELLHRFELILVETVCQPPMHLKPCDSLAYAFLFAGVMRVLQIWLESGQRVPVSELVDYLAKNLENGFLIFSDYKKNKKYIAV